MRRVALPAGHESRPGYKSLGIDPDAPSPATVRAVPPVQGAIIPPPLADGRPAKYRNVRTAYDGRAYDSKAQARRAEELDGFKAAGAIIDHFPQVLVRLDSLTYRVDFLVVHPAGCWFEDVKGKETQRTRDLLKLWRDHGRLPLHLLFKDGTEIILPRSHRP